MGDGEDSFAKTVFDFIEILAEDVKPSLNQYASVMQLLNGYMPMIIELVESDRGRRRKRFTLEMCFIDVVERLLMSLGSWGLNLEQMKTQLPLCWYLEVQM
jgi:hypothetical protein